MNVVFFATAGQAAPKPTMAPRFQHRGIYENVQSYA